MLFIQFCLNCSWKCLWWRKLKLRLTVMFLSFRTDRSGQTVQTQIRLLIRFYTVCNSLCIFWMHYSKEKPSCSTFRMITANFQMSEILGFLFILVCSVTRFEPRHDKTNKMTVHPAKTQISLSIRPVWSESSLCASWVAKNPRFLHTHSEDWSDWADAQADLSLRWAQSHFVGFVMLWPIWFIL